MNSLVVYATRTDNTRRVAAAIADALRTRGSVELVAAEAAPTALPHGTDLLVVGGPTEGHGMTDAIKRFLDVVDLTAIDGTAVAAFDTRLRWPKLLSGSAAEGIAERLRADGAEVIVPPESFIVTRKPELEPGELERAAAWAATVADATERRKAALPVG